MKYERAKQLCQKVKEIRKDYQYKLLNGADVYRKQIGTAAYFIDRLALRVGGEKNTEEEADTVGCCSLRVEHMKLEPPNIIHLNFLGKDSIEYKNSVTVTDQVYQNIGEFLEGKKPSEDVFDKVQPGIV